MRKEKYFDFILQFFIGFIFRALASLNLPAALEDVCNEEELPESIREKSARVKGLGGVQAIQQMIGELPGLLKRNQELIDEVSYLDMLAIFEGMCFTKGEHSGKVNFEYDFLLTFLFSDCAYLDR